GHDRELLLDQAKLADGLVELLALRGVAGRIFDQALGSADAAGREPEPAIVEDRHRDLEPTADLTEHVGRGDLAVVEVDHRGARALDAELVLLGPALDATEPALDDERGDAILLLAIDLDRRLGEHG